MTKTRFKFSVSMSVYNGDNPLIFRVAIESIFNQTLMPDEVVLVVDGPVQEKTKVIIKEFESLHAIKVIWLQENMGHGFARRKGLENCNHDYVAIMDSDDICVYDRFEKQILCFIKDDNLSVVGGSINEFVNDISNIVGKRLLPCEDNEIKKFLKLRCPFNQMTVMFKKEDVEKAGGYLTWYHNEDYYLWVRMSLSGAKFLNLKDVLVHARTGKDFYDRRGGWKYFISESKLQKYMYLEKIIDFYTLVTNITIRFVVQCLLPNKARRFIFKKYFRD